MTLDERIQKDLTELYNGGDNQGEIKNALALNPKRSLELQ